MYSSLEAGKSPGVHLGELWEPFPRRPEFRDKEESLSHRYELFESVNSADHMQGNKNARVVVLEYGDFECPNCKQAATAMQQLLNRFVDQVLFVYRHFPLTEVHGHALGAAQAAECAGAQGKFWEMHALLFEHQAHLSRRSLDRYAKQIGLDMIRYNAEMDDEIYRQRILEHMESGRRSGVRSTPGFFIDGKMHDVSYGLHSLLDATKVALDCGRASIGKTT